MLDLPLAVAHVQQTDQTADDEPRDERSDAHNDVGATRLVLLGHCGRIVMIVIVNNIDLNGGFGLGSGGGGVGGCVGGAASAGSGCNT